MTYSLSRFSFNDMMDCRTRIRSLISDEPRTFSEGAERIVRFFYDELQDEDRQPACALVRFFKTHRFPDLDADTQKFAEAMIPPDAQRSDLRCLTLLATRGSEPGWNSRTESRGHRAIPLHSIDMVEQAPMIAQLIKQMGLSIANVVRPPIDLLLNRDDASYNVFHVPVATGSPHIVAQREFVIPFGIASVLGFGGLLASGDMFAVIMFSKVSITADVAAFFKVIGLNMKIAVLSLVGKPLF